MVLSEDGSITQQFFNELAIQLTSKNNKNKELAKKFRNYSKKLAVIPAKKSLAELVSFTLLALGFLGVPLSGLISESFYFQICLLIGSLFVIGLSFSKHITEKLANLYESKFEDEIKSIYELKLEIREELNKRNTNLIIVIDDIDRLNQSEMRQIFRLVKANADFPKAIYLLSMDREIVEKNLQEQIGIDGNEYLDKIIQVPFNVPNIGSTRILDYLIKNLNETLSNKLPESANKY